MHNDFIQVKSLEGELKLSQKKARFGCTVTTKELIFQKPHHSYQIILNDIISIVPYEIKSRSITFSPQNTGYEERVITSFSSRYYKVSAHQVKLYNRTGITIRGRTEFIIPLSPKALDHIAEYSNLTVVE